jgi:hypothetical protein
MTKKKHLNKREARRLAEKSFNDVLGFIKKYVRVTDDEAIAAALFVMTTHAIDAFDVVPYLGITSPEPEAGKTQLIDTLGALVARPYRAEYCTPYEMAEAIDADGVTVLYDEADATLKGREKLRGIFNAGYKRGGVYRTRVGGERRALSVFGPKAFSGIGDLPATIASRCFPISMQRLLAGEEVASFERRDALLEAAPMKALLDNWAEYFVKQRGVEPKDIKRFNSRSREIARPLLRIAEFCSSAIAARAADALYNLRSTSVNHTSPGVELLGQVRDFFKEQEPYLNMFSRAGVLRTADIARRTGLSEKMVANTLAPYGVRPKQIRFGTQNNRGYDESDFADAWARYLPEDG